MIESCPRETSSGYLARLAYWTSFAEYLSSNETMFKISVVDASLWQPFPIGRRGFGINATVSSLEPRVSIGLSVYHDTKKIAFHTLEAEKTLIEQEFGEPLDWRWSAGKVTSIILHREGVDLADENQHLELHAWMLNRMVMFHRVFAGRIKTLPLGEYDVERDVISSWPQALKRNVL